MPKKTSANRAVKCYPKQSAFAKSKVKQTRIITLGLSTRRRAQYTRVTDI